MLRRLYIRNYLLIDEIELVLDKGLTIITGETGSGKSITVDALALAMGARAEAGAQRDPAQRCIIELEVDLRGLDLAQWFEAAEIPQERTVILRRQLDPGGRSRAFVNDTPVRLEQLRELGERLVHIHSQHHSLLLNDPRFQLGLVDHVAGQRKELAAYGTVYAEWRRAARELGEVKEEEGKARYELDHLQFLLSELDEARPAAEEQDAIEIELGRAENAEELTQGLNSIQEGITGDRGISEGLQRIRQTVQKAARMDPAILALQERLESASIELKDISEEAEHLAAAITVDPKRAGLLRDRLDLILRLQQKHRVGSNSELIGIQEDLRTRVVGIGSLEERIKGLEQDLARMNKEVNAQAKGLSRGRLAAVEPLAEKVTGILQELGMPRAVFRFEHQLVEPGPQGIDTLRAVFSANAERAPAPLDKVASGGELSRVMLALISLAADSQDLPTVVFDEIDTGVSGEVADRVGGLMRHMGTERQVLAITHLPQIASKANTHLVVTKDQEVATGTSIRAVHAEERVQALAQMLSGRKLTKAALENARVLLRTDRKG